MPEPPQPHPGHCHCGTVRFTALLTDGLTSPSRCNCSICRMRGAVVVSSTPSGFKILQGADALTTYRFNTGTAEHFFCSKCGIYTHHKRRSDPNSVGVNVACLEGVSPFDFREVVVEDGVHHLSDNGGVEKDLGTLRFVPAE